MEINGESLKNHVLEAINYNQKEMLFQYLSKKMNHTKKQKDATYKENFDAKHKTFKNGRLSF